MNERIKELAELSGATVITTHGMEDVVDGCYVIEPTRLEKFAELIIKECINIGEQTSKNIFEMSKKEGDKFEYYSHGAEWAVDDIKEHFGLE